MQNIALIQKLGKIHLTTSIEKEARRLTINLIKVDDLPKWGIIGAPGMFLVLFTFAYSHYYRCLCPNHALSREFAATNKEFPNSQIDHKRRL